MVSIKRAVSSLMRGVLGGDRRRRARDREVLADSALFDPDWYRATYPEVVAEGWDPVDHYLAFGATGQTSPGPTFDAAAYLAANPDVAADRSNPLLHYIEHGRRERRPLVRQVPVVDEAEQRWVATRDAIAASGFFDPAWYLARYPELAETDWDPLAHFTTFGLAQGTSPGPDFDTEAYLEAVPEAAGAGVHPVLHFLRDREGASLPQHTRAMPEIAARLLASGLFDPHWYAARYFDGALPPERALDHYLRAARSDAHAPGPYFEPQEYRKTHPDIAGTGLSAIAHYLLHGMPEDRCPNPWLDPAWYREAYPDIADTCLDPVAHFARVGDSEGRQPGPDFRPAAYLANCPSARQSGLPPLADFLTRHWGAGCLGLLAETAGPHEPIGFSVIVRLSPAGNLGATLESLAFQGRAAIEVLLVAEPGQGVDLAVAQAHTWRTKPWGGSGRIIARPVRSFAEALHGARQSFVAVLDAGDIVLPCALLRLRDRIVTDGCDIAYGDEEYFSPEGVEFLLKPGWSPEMLSTYNYFGRLTALRRRLLPSIFEETGAAAEWALNLAAARATGRVAHVPEVLCRLADPGRLDHLQPARAPEAFARVLTAHWRASGVEADVQLASDGTLIARWDLAETPLVSVIVPNRDKPELIRTLVEGLTERTAYPALEILVVDNGSTDPATLAFYAERADRLRVVAYAEAFNYARACNLGAAVARGDLLLFLNNDIAIDDPDWLVEMVRRALRPGVGIVGPKLVYPDGEIQHAGVAIGLMRLSAHVFHRGPQYRHGVFGSPDVLRNWSAVTGACQLVRRAAFERVGGYDEAFQIAYSDLALCLDIVRTGYRVVYTPYARLTHHESATRGNDTPYRDQILFARRVRALGIEVDPLFHPRLDGFHTTPRLAEPGGRPAGAGLRAVLERIAGPSVEAGIVDPHDDGALATAAGLPWSAIAALTAPGAPEQTLDWGARLILDVLRRRPELRARFPQALSEGAAGPFACWLREQGLRLYDAGPDFASSIDVAFAAGMGDRPRQRLVHHLVTQGSEPLLLLPNGSAAACRILFAAVRAEDLTAVEVLWYLVDAAERPGESLELTWALSPDWQAAVPDGGSVFGIRRLVRWVAERYGITQDWLFAQHLPTLLPDGDQIRLGRRMTGLSDASVRSGPAPLPEQGVPAEEDAREAGALLRDWNATRDPAVLAAALDPSGVNLIGPAPGLTGPARLADNMAESLLRAGLTLSRRDVPAAIDAGPPASLAFGLEVHAITLLHLEPGPGTPRRSSTALSDPLGIGLLYGRAGLMPDRASRYRIGCWTAPLGPAPSDWDRAAAGCDEFWAPTEFVAQGFRARWRQPVRVLFPGLEVEPPTDRSRARLGLPEDRFVFTSAIHLNGDLERKNPAGLVRAFRMAFGERDDVSLVLKVTAETDQRAEVERLRALAGDTVRIIDAIWPRDKVLGLIAAADAYVSLHRSTGVGLDLMEAMLLGKPVVATRYSGNLDYMSDANSLLVDCRMAVMDRDDLPDRRRPVWAEPSLAHAAAQMRRIYEDRALARALGDRGRDDLRALYAYARCGRAMADRLAEIRAGLGAIPSSKG